MSSSIEDIFDNQEEHDLEVKKLKAYCSEHEIKIENAVHGYQNSEIGLTRWGKLGIIIYSNELTQTRKSSKALDFIECPFEIIPIKKYPTHANLEARVHNPELYGATGSISAVVTSSLGDYLLTCSHVALAGRGLDFTNKEIPESLKAIEILDDFDDILESGNVEKAVLNGMIDAALIKIEDPNYDWSNEHPKGIISGSTSIENLKNGDIVKYYSSLRSREIKVRIQNRKSLQKITFEYKDLSLVEFSDLIVITSESIGSIYAPSVEGESGSLLCNSDWKPFAMIIGGGGNYSFAVPLVNILNQFNIQIK